MRDGRDLTTTRITNDTVPYRPPIHRNNQPTAADNGRPSLPGALSMNSTEPKNKPGKQTYRELGIDDVTFTMSAVEIQDLRRRDNATRIFGQPRAVRALRTGTEIRATGYNIFVTGPTGTGRSTAVRQTLRNIPSDLERLRDIAYVYNFSEPDNPKTLYFPPGRAQRFKRDIHALVETLKVLVTAKLESDEYTERRDTIVGAIEQEENHALAEFESVLAEEGFQIARVQDGEGAAADIVPLKNGEPTDFDTLHAEVTAGKMDEEEWHRLREGYYRHIDEMRKLFADLRNSRSVMEEEVANLQSELLEPEIRAETDRLKDSYVLESETPSEVGYDTIDTYLDALAADVAENLYLFTGRTVSSDRDSSPPLARYGVNVIVDHSSTEKAPVIYEYHPSYRNMFGAIEARFDPRGEARTNFMLIKAGSLIKASGGFIILRAEDLLKSEESWEHLKTALRTGRVEIQFGTDGPYTLPGPVLKPEAVEIDTKVIIIGPENLYDSLYASDPDLIKLFKISAEFDSVMDRDEETCSQYLHFMDSIAADEGLMPIDAGGASDILRYGVMQAELRDKLSARFSMIADLIRESHYWAGKIGKTVIDAESVERALEERKFMHDLPEEKAIEAVMIGEVTIDTRGTAVGMVNGLAIHDRGFYSFGAPIQISARIAPGSEGIVNIEREVGLSGEIHDKWVMILEGFLRHRYARTFPLSVFASICFEQSYGEIDGDSASSAEVYAVLSAVSGVALRQDIAVTGSMNQMGQVQPVGGIAEKVTGFYRVCAAGGLTGNQGVIIPEQNAANLILTGEVREAIGEGRFHVYPIETIDQGLEILTGRSAGKPTKKGTFEPGSVNAQVEQKLKSIADMVKTYNA